MIRLRLATVQLRRLLRPLLRIGFRVHSRQVLSRFALCDPVTPRHYAVVSYAQSTLPTPPPVALPVGPLQFNIT